MDKQIRHTPGPWTYGDMRDEKPGYFWISGPCGNLGHIVGDREFNGKSNAESNARLIAAAPELLKALEIVLKTMYAYPELNVDMITRCSTTVKNAIAKAEGQ